MGKVINFSKSLEIQTSKPHFSESNQEKKSQTNLWMLFEEEKFFIQTIQKWPCFSSMKKNFNPSDILTQYCNNLLSESQECAIDFLLHIHDPTFVFDLNYSLKKWGKEDRDFFLQVLKKHSKALEKNH